MKKIVLKNTKYIKSIGNNKAITLIALVITIVILIILAAVAINLTIGENGIIARAKRAAELNRYEQAREKIVLKVTDIKTQCQEEGKTCTIEDLYTGFAQEEADYFVDNLIYEDIAVVRSKAQQVRDTNTSNTNKYLKNIVTSHSIAEEFKFLLDGEGEIQGITKCNNPEDIDNVTFLPPGDIEQLIGGGKDVPTQPEEPQEPEEPTPEEVVTSSISISGSYQKNITLTLSGTTDQTKIEKMELYVNDSKIYTYTYNNEQQQSTKQEIYLLQNLDFYADNNCKLVVTATSNKQQESDIVNAKNTTTISTAQDLINFRNQVNINNNHFENQTINQIADITVSNWIPIGYGDSANWTGKYFSGIYNGNSKYIQINSIGSMPQDYAYGFGIFGQVIDGKIQNLTSKGTLASSSTIAISGIVGMMKGTQTNKAEITGCTNLANITGNANTAGICGYAEKIKIENCANYANLSGSTFTGGICGQGKDTKITKCRNTHSITSNSVSCAGIVANCVDSEITICYNRGNITASQENVGGIVGSGNGGTVKIENCYNSGSLSGSQNVGGIIGLINSWDKSVSGNISYCYNIGKCVGMANTIGGIVGNHACMQNNAPSGTTFDSTATILYSYWSDKDKNNNALPTDLGGSTYNVNKVNLGSGNSASGRYNLSSFCSPDPWSGQGNMSYWLNGVSNSGAWTQDFDATGGYINDKYPYLVENPPVS